jgi:predicted membrane protein
MSNISRTKIISCMAVIMLMLIITTGSFSIPIGVSVCSILGTAYGYKYKDKGFLKWSLVALFIGIVSIIYTLMLIKSM